MTSQKQEQKTKNKNSRVHINQGKAFHVLYVQLVVEKMEKIRSNRIEFNDNDIQVRNKKKS